VSMHTLDVKGDGKTDVPGPAQAAIKNTNLFLPSGFVACQARSSSNPTVLMEPTLQHLLSLIDGSPGFAGRRPVGVLVAQRAHEHRGFDQCCARYEQPRRRRWFGWREQLDAG
jgi:hypothetical protein